MDDEEDEEERECNRISAPLNPKIDFRNRKSAREEENDFGINSNDGDDDDEEEEEEEGKDQEEQEEDQQEEIGTRIVAPARPFLGFDLRRKRARDRDEEEEEEEEEEEVIPTQGRENNEQTTNNEQQQQQQQQQQQPKRKAISRVRIEQRERMTAPSKSLEKEFRHQLRDLLDQCPYFFYLRGDDFGCRSDAAAAVDNGGGEDEETISNESAGRGSKEKTKGMEAITNIFRSFVVERAMIRSSSLSLLKRYYLLDSNKSGCLHLTKRRTNEREHLLKVLFDVPDFFKMTAVISMPKGVSTAEILSFTFFAKKATRARREKKNVRLTRAQMFNVIETSLLSKPQWHTMTRERVSHSVRALVSRLNVLMPSSGTNKALLDVETLAFCAARVAKMPVFPAMPLFLMRERQTFLDENRRNKNCVSCAPDILERDNTFVFISLYSGAGITIAGLRSAGGILALAVERDEEKRKILRRNNPGVKILDDVSNVNDEVIREIFDRYNVVHLIEAGVPCKDVSGENNFRGKKPLEEVLFPFLEVFRVADLVVAESMKRKTNDFVAPLVLIENVECIAKRWDVVNPPYLVNLMEMCAQRKMGYAYRPLSAESAGGLNLSRTRIFFVATRSKEINLKRVMLFAEDETSNIECKRECVYSWNRSGCGLCFLCINASRNAREAKRNPFEHQKIEQKFRFRAVNIASQRSVGSEATTTVTNVTATNASSLILVDKLGLFKPAFVSLEVLSKMFGLSAGKFFFENDDASSTSSYKRMLGDSATCTLPYILGRAFVMDKIWRARASPFEKKNGEDQSRFFVHMTQHYKNERRLAASLFLNRYEQNHRSRQNSRALATFPSQHGVFLPTTAYDKDYDESDWIDFFVDNMKISKVALCSPTRVESQAWERISDDAMDEMESVPNARLKTYRTVMRREAQSAAFMKLDARVRAGLGFTEKDAMIAMITLVKINKANSALFFCSFKNTWADFFIPVLRIKKTVFELGDAIKETLASALVSGELFSFEDAGNQALFFSKLQACAEEEPGRYLRVAHARAKEIEKHMI